jgi:hypothetical protein
MTQVIGPTSFNRYILFLFDEKQFDNDSKQKKKHDNLEKTIKSM